MQERRLLDRVTPGTDVRVRLETGEEHVGRVVDMSSRGARVELETDLEPERSIDLVVHLNDREFTVRATVRHCREATSEGQEGRVTYLHGLEFAPLEEEVTAHLDRELLRRAAARSKSTFVFEN